VNPTTGAMKIAVDIAGEVVYLARKNAVRELPARSAAAVIGSYRCKARSLMSPCRLRLLAAEALARIHREFAENPAALQVVVGVGQ
jgi:hypothetical protein